MKPDYAEVISATDYTEGLSEHPDIPQSDTGIVRTIGEKAKGFQGANFRILDLGCGPGRITKQIAEAIELIGRGRFTVEIIGLDISQGFIEYAQKHLAHEAITYVLADFLTHNFTSQFDVIVMQGMAHHVPTESREAWFKKCRAQLAADGLVIIGDEFVPNYETEEERLENVAGLYAYVIANAVQSKHKALADIESMNMVDDVSSGTTGAGHSDQELRDFIKNQSQIIYRAASESGTKSETFRNLLTETVRRIKARSVEIAEVNHESHDRGDYKISIEAQKRQLTDFGFTLVDVKK